MNSSLRICLTIMVVMTTSLEAQVPSLGALRRVITRKYTPQGHRAKMQAAADICDYADNNTLRFVISRIRKTSKELASMEASMAKLANHLDDLRAKLKKARKKGAGSVSKSDVDEEKEKRNEEKSKSRAFNDTTEFLIALRKSVGVIVKKLAPEERDKALKTMIKAYKKGRDPDDKLEILRVIIGCESPEIAPLLSDLADSKDHLDRLRVLVAAESWGGLRALRLALSCLEDEKWQVRAQAIRVLKSVGGRRALDFLIATMTRETGRLKSDAISALRFRTGQNFRTNEHLWKRWLDANSGLLDEPTESTNAKLPEKPEPVAQESGKEDEPEDGGKKSKKPKAPAPGGTGFYGVESKSKHVIYVLDFSGSMSHAKGNKDAGTEKISLYGKRRIDHLAVELLRTVNALSKDSTFNVVVFTHAVTTWQKKMVYATKENKESLKRWLLRRGPSGSTNLFGGLEEAFRFAGRGSYDESYDTAADTIFLLSDGQPSAGRLIKADAILTEIRRINALRRIAIHGVFLGSHGGGLLRRLAQDNDGQFVKIPD